MGSIKKIRFNILVLVCGQVAVGVTREVREDFDNGRSLVSVVKLRQAFYNVPRQRRHHTSALGELPVSTCGSNPV